MINHEYTMEAIIEASNEFHNHLKDKNSIFELKTTKDGIEARISSSPEYYHEYSLLVKGDNMFEIYARANAEFKILQQYL